MSDFLSGTGFRPRAWAVVLSLVLLGFTVGLLALSGAHGAGQASARPRQVRRPTDGSVSRQGEARSVDVAPRIVGGGPAAIGDWPFFTSLSYGPIPRNRPFCGASLIDERWVLTAAHCVAGIDRVFATIGRDRIRNPESPGEAHTAKKIFVHPDYDEYSLRWDAALIHLPSRSSVATIDTAGNTPEEGETVRVAGYGLEREDAARGSSRLKETSLSMIGDDRCLDILYGSWMHAPSMICAWERDTDSCYGDSGGPLVHEGRLVGLVSWGFGCARPDAPGVYTRVESIGGWLDSVMKGDGRRTRLRFVEKWQRSEGGAAYVQAAFTRPVRAARFRFTRSVTMRGQQVRPGKWIPGLTEGVYAGVTDLTRNRRACAGVTLKARFADRTISHSTRVCLPR